MDLMSLNFRSDVLTPNRLQFRSTILPVTLYDYA